MTSKKGLKFLPPSMSIKEAVILLQKLAKVNMSIGSMNVNFIRALFLQMGHSNHSLGVFDGIFKFGSYLAIHFDLSPSADDRRSAKRDADTLCKLRGHLFLIPRRAPNK